MYKQYQTVMKSIKKQKYPFGETFIDLKNGMFIVLQVIYCMINLAAGGNFGSDILSDADCILHL